MSTARQAAASPPRICAGCGRTRLSRYNPHHLCASCTRAGTGTAPPSPTPPRRPPPGIWHTPAMRHLLARCDFGAAIALFRAATGLSQTDLGRLTGWTQAAVSMVENGHRDTLFDIRALLRFADTIGIPRHALLPVILGHPTPPTTATPPGGHPPTHGGPGTRPRTGPVAGENLGTACVLPPQRAVQDRREHDRM